MSPNCHTDFVQCLRNVEMKDPNQSIKSLLKKNNCFTKAKVGKLNKP